MRRCEGVQSVRGGSRRRQPDNAIPVLHVSAATGAAAVWCDASVGTYFAITTTTAVATYFMLHSSSIDRQCFFYRMFF